MKRSESDGTDLEFSKKVLMGISLFLLTGFGTASANQIHLYSNKDAYQGVLVIKDHVINVESIMERGIIEGIFLGNPNNGLTDSVNDGTGGSTDSVNDGTGGSTDSVNDGTGGSTDSVNDGTGGSTDSVNDGTGGIESVNDGTGGLIEAINNGADLVFSIDTYDCSTMYVSTNDNDYKVTLNTIKLDNNDMKCQ